MDKQLANLETLNLIADQAEAAALEAAKIKIHDNLAALDSFCRGAPLDKIHLINAITMAVRMARLYIKESI
jgi:hypothetical protein